MADSEDPLSSYSDTERQIFDAALRVFARDGRRGARMQDIADTAGINKAMLHYYFRDKASLYEEVFGYTMRRAMASLSEPLQEGSTFRETLRAFIDNHIDFIRDNEEAIRLMVGENISGGALLKKHLQKMNESEQVPPHMLVEQIEKAVQAGEIRPVDPYHTAASIISLSISFLMAEPAIRKLHPEADADWSAFVEDRKEHLFDLLYRGLAPVDEDSDA